MKPEICAYCKQNVSLPQTDLCKNCLREKFKGLIPIIDKLHPLDSNFSRVSTLKQPRGAA